jgi:hypothetical protein
MIKSILALSMLLVLSNVSYADDEFKVVGMPSIAANAGNAFLNFGGPSFKVESGGYFGGLSFYPSLRYNTTANDLTPILGAGLFVGRNNLFLVIPTYFYTASWHPALGLGYKF